MCGIVVEKIPKNIGEVCGIWKGKFVEFGGRVRFKGRSQG